MDPQKSKIQTGDYSPVCIEKRITLRLQQLLLQQPRQL